MRVAKVIFVMVKHKVGTSGWEYTDWIYSNESDAKDAAKRFTAESVGWKFSTRKFKEVV